MATDRRTAQFFISYAREDKAFALRLRRALAAAGRLGWLDLKNIGALAPWRREIAAAIDAADVFVFLISPDAVASAACREELKLAVDARKRLAPLVWRETDAKAVPAVLQEQNWLFAGAAEPVERLAARLVEAADRDPDWIRDHSRLLTRAREWRQHRREPSRLLSGQGLQDALRWLADSGRRGDRPVSALHAEYIEASRAADAAAAAHQRELYLKALARQLAAQSELTRDDAEEGGAPVAALLAAESLRRWPTVEGDRALRRSLQRLPRPALLRLPLAGDPGLLLTHDAGLLVVARGRTLRAVELPAGRECWRVRLPWPGDIAFNADESCIVATPGDHRCQLVATADGRLLGPPALPGESMAFVTLESVAHERHRLTVRRRGTPGSALFSVEPEVPIHRAAVLADGAVLVAVAQAAGDARRTQVLAWDTAGGPSRVLWELYGSLKQVVLEPRGDWIALTVHPFMSGPPKQVHVGRLAERAASADADRWALQALDHDEPIDSIAADGPQRLVAFTGGGSMVHVWEPWSTRLLGRWRVGERCAAATLAADGQRLLVALAAERRAGRPSRVALVDASGRHGFTAPAPWPCPVLACDAQGQVVAGGGRELVVWDSDTGSEVQRLPSTGSRVLRFSADSSHALVDADDGLLIVPTTRGLPALRLASPGAVADAAFVGDDARQLVVVGSPVYGSTPRGDPHARWWDLAQGRVLCTRRREATLALALTRDGRQMASYVPSLGQVHWRDLRSGRLLRRFDAVDAEELRWDAAGTHIACREAAGRLKVWRVADGRTVADLEAGSYLRSFDAAAGLALLGGIGGGGTLLELDGGRVLAEDLAWPAVDYHRGLLACRAGDQHVELRPLRGGRAPLRLVHPYANEAVFVPGSEHLVTQGADGSARVWQLGSGSELARLEHPDRVLEACVSPDGRFILTRCKDGQLRLWTWRADDLTGEAQARVGRRLTAAELVRFLPDPETRRA